MKHVLVILILLAASVLGVACERPAGTDTQAAAVATPEQAERSDYLALVTAYADAMVAHGRDRYGDALSPLFASALDRHTLALRYDTANAPTPEARSLAERLAEQGHIGLGAFARIRGVREHDRTLNGSNPNQQADLYQTLHALTLLTGDAAYAAEADAAVAWFFENTPHPATALLPWGEHLGWDFVAEQAADRDRYRGTFIHEFANEWPWHLTYRVAPDAAVRYAQALWDHQIGDKATGDYDRHASWDRHNPGTSNQFPAHASRYTNAWLHAYRHTGDSAFLDHVVLLARHFDGRRRASDGAIPARDEDWDSGVRGHDVVLASQELSLAVRWHEAADVAAEPDATFLREAARRSDEALLGHHAEEVGPTASAYARYQQTGDSRWRDLVVESARGVRLKHLRNSTGYHDPNRDTIRNTGMSYPLDVAGALFLQLRAHELTGEERHLRRAHEIAALGVKLFLGADSPLPKATNRHDHYEALTGGPSFMLALLALHVREARPDLDLGLVFELEN